MVGGGVKIEMSGLAVSLFVAVVVLVAVLRDLLREPVTITRKSHKMRGGGVIQD
jgi:hypothetical protein